ncbi:MAG: FkbM family methyltransferase [Burkholderiales bacterium]|uniref:FkbM family methyltransferase n=1 Tax=Inhella sp. TaxID=1921806 RepID=UPI001AC9417C|nr:FkbM family methyltransferase [Burkholderiales bacterium]
MPTLAELQAAHRAGHLSKADFIAQACALHQQLWAYQALLSSEGVRELRVSAQGVEFLMQEEAVWIAAPAGEARVAPLETLNFGGAYEAAESRAMDVLASGSRCMLDVGANLGIHALRLALREPQSLVHAFEPMPQSFDYLSRNIARNGLGDRVRAHGFGLSRENGSFEFHIAPENGTNASLLNVAGRTDAQRVVGLTLRLDDWVANTGCAPDYLKVDVEGAELWVFEGGAQTIERHRPRVFCELLRKWSAPFGYHPNDVLRFFAERGYGCWAVSETGVRELAEVDDATPETNYAFLHRAQHATCIDRLLALPA